MAQPTMVSRKHRRRARSVWKRGSRRLDPVSRWFLWGAISVGTGLVILAFILFN
ncbi:MAG: hypothetical protein JJU36_17475 [Phycisphaeraceae bacterium]|nr:hypothetical protein [Phycisphaeraceae bacterium]